MYWPLQIFSYFRTLSKAASIKPASEFVNSFGRHQNRNDLNKSNLSLRLTREFAPPTFEIKRNLDISFKSNCSKPNEKSTEKMSGGLTQKTAEPTKTKIVKPPSTVDVDSTISSIQNLSLENVKEEIIKPEPEPEPITTMDDIQIVGLRDGQKLFCLDFSNIEKGFISASINDVKAVAFIDSLCSKTSDYCNRQYQSYSPQPGEVCLCKFEDNQWYRALVSKVIDSSTFEVTSIDYGNMTTVSSKDVRKIPKEFVHPCLMNKCNIKGESF